MAYDEKPPFEDASTVKAWREGRIGSDGQGIITEYPKTLYKAGESKQFLNEEAQKLPYITAHAESAEHEAEMVAGGWFLTPELKKTARQLELEELAALRAKVAEQSEDAPEAIKRGPGRPRAETANG